MPIPTVDITQSNGALKSLPGNVLGDIAVVAGPSTTGDLLIPAAYARPEDVIADFGAGPMVELAATLLTRAPGKPLIVCRTGADTDGDYGAVDDTGMTGACTPSEHTATVPYDEYEARVDFVTGGTVGVAGITYQWSLDDGRTKSAVTALGTATTITFGAGNVAFDLTAASVVAGDYFRCRTVAPQLSAQNLADAQTAIQEISLPWDFVAWANPLDATAIGLNDVWLQAMWDLGVCKKSMGSWRGPNEGETEAQYLAAFAAAMAGVTSSYQAIGAGYCEFVAATNGKRQYRRPMHWIVAVRALRVTRPTRTDLAEYDLGSLGPDIKIRDASGNRKAGLHDELIDPGLDTLGAMTLYTAKDRNGNPIGVYLTTPNIICADDDDGYLWQYRSLRNKTADAVRTALLAWARRPLAIVQKTGYLQPKEASNINADVDDIVRTAVGDSVTAAGFQINTTDSLAVKNPRLAGKQKLVPLVYPAGFDVDLSFAISL